MVKISSPFVIIKKAFGVFTDKENFKFLIKVYSPAGVLFTISLLFTYIPFLSNISSTSGGSVTTAFFNLLFAFAMLYVNLAGIIAIIDIENGKRVDVRSIYKNSLSKLWKFIVLSLTIYLIDALALALLILPFFLAVTWFAFSKFIMVDRGLGIKESLLRSKKMTKGIFWKILLRIFIFGLFTFIAQMFLGTIPYGIGMVIFYLCGGLFILPGFLLYKEISALTVSE